MLVPTVLTEYDMHHQQEPLQDHGMQEIRCRTLNAPRGRAGELAGPGQGHYQAYGLRHDPAEASRPF